jgi:hypothetical protein
MATTSPIDLEGTYIRTRASLKTPDVIVRHVFGSLEETPLPQQVKKARRDPGCLAVLLRPVETSRTPFQRDEITDSVSPGSTGYERVQASIRNSLSPEGEWKIRLFTKLLTSAGLAAQRNTRQHQVMVDHVSYDWSLLGVYAVDVEACSVNVVVQATPLSMVESGTNNVFLAWSSAIVGSNLLLGPFDSETQLIMSSYDLLHIVMRDTVSLARGENVFVSGACVDLAFDHRVLLNPSLCCNLRKQT